MGTKQHFSLKAEFKALLTGDLDRADRDALALLAIDPDIERTWARIVNVCGKGVNQPFFVRLFFQNIIGSLHNAKVFDTEGDYLEHAKKAQDLAMFLDRLPMPAAALPAISTATWANVLKEVASTLRETNQKALVRRTRHRIERRRIYFMRLASLTMHEWLGHWFDAEVAYFTNIFFPEADTTTDMVRATRRPSTSKGRAGSRTAK